MNYLIEYLLRFFSKTQPRKASVLRQILINKKTGSVLYWAFRYDYLDYLNLYPQLNIIEYNQSIDLLIKKGYLKKTSAGEILTNEGANQLKHFSKRHYFIERPDLFQRYDYELWNAIFLILVQVASEFSYHNHQYYVASENLQAQFLVKKWLGHFGFETLKGEIQNLLSAFLDNQVELKANVFAAKLIGHQQNGLTNQQIAIQLQLAETDVELIWRDLSLQFADFLINQNTPLKKLVEMTQLSGILSNSIYETKRLFSLGLNVEQISFKRHLKVSTVEEHLIILAISDVHFPFNLFLSTDEIEFLNKVFKTTDIDKWSYRILANQGKEIPFIKFRLYAIMRTHDERRKSI